MLEREPERKSDFPTGLDMIGVGALLLIGGGLAWSIGALFDVQLLRQIGLPATAGGIALTGSGLIAVLL